MDEAGTPTAEITGVYLQRVQRRTVPIPLAQKIFDTVWVPALDPDRTGAIGRAVGSWLVLTDDAETEEIAQDFTADSAHRPGG